MITYRRRRGKDVWHWCTNCTDWPEEDFIVVEKEFRPTSYELCDQCFAKEKAGNCIKEVIVSDQP